MLSPLFKAVWNYQK